KTVKRFDVQLSSRIPMSDSVARYAEADRAATFFGPHALESGADRLSIAFCDTRACAEARGAPTVSHLYEHGAGNSWRRAAAVDSIVLVRTLCLGTCPAYRISVRRDGEVHFQSRNPGEKLDTVGHVAPSTLDSLYRRAADARFFSLPDNIDRKS